MSRAGEGYLTDVVYPSRFYDFLSPTLLGYVARLNGFEAHPGRGQFRYLELGCGGGLTLVTLAAAHPRGRFIGVDFNPRHVAEARELAASGSVDNVAILEASFAELEELALGSFDFVVLHGVWSWVSAEVRTSLLDFLESGVRPGGTVLLSYNALPGSLVLQPLRDEMLALTLHLQGDSAARMAAGLAHLRRLAEGGAEYFRHHPELGRSLASASAPDLDALAHEFLNRDWQPMYFRAVAAELASVGLAFAGSLPVAANYLELAVPEAQQDSFRRVPGRIAAESQKALALNERFRRDVYVRPTSPALPEEERHRLFSATRFGARAAELDEGVTVAVGSHRVTLELRGARFDALRAVLEAEAPTLEELVKREPFRGDTRQDLLEHLQLLVASGQCLPFAEPPLAIPERPADGGLEVPAQLNRVLLERAAGAGEGAFLASAVAGDGVGISAVDTLLIEAAARAGVEGAVTAALARLEASGRSLVAEGETLEDQGRAREALAARLGELVRLPVTRLRRLGVLG